MLNEPYEQLPPKLRPSRKEQRCKIQLHSDNSQLSSLLFSKLSPELRALVYSFIFPHQTVHINYKECLRKNRWTRIQRVRRNYTPTKRLKHPILKVTSQICLFPYDWERRYALSKQPAAIPKEFYANDAYVSLFGYCPEAINAHHLQHARCVMGTRNRGRSWETGVAGEKIDLSWLQVCRRLYHETWCLPFANFTFEFNTYSLSLREDFLDRILYKHQAKAIQRVHVHDLMKPTDYIGAEGLFSSFPRLKHLRLSFIHGLRAEGCEEDWEGFCEAGTCNLQIVEVIAGHDDDKEQDKRALNRRKAIAAEMLLLGKERWQKRQLIGPGAAEVMTLSRKSVSNRPGTNFDV